MSVAALVARVGEVLGRGHALFGQPPASGGSAALDASTGLTRAGDLVATGQQRMTALAGALPDSYGRFTNQTGPVLVSAATADTGLSAQLQDAASSDRAGRQASGSVVNAAASDTSTLAPTTSTAAGQRALISALRTRVAQQQQLITTQQARSAQLAAAVRSLGYSGAQPVGGGGSPAGMSMGGMPFGGGGGGSGSGGGSPLSGLSGLSSLSKLIARPRSAARPSQAAGLAIPDRVVGTPLGALTLNSGPREVAAAIIHEAQRRGYSPYQTTAILADAMQESALSLRRLRRVVRPQSVADRIGLRLTRRRAVRHRNMSAAISSAAKSGGPVRIWAATPLARDLSLCPGQLGRSHTDRSKLDLAFYRGQLGHRPYRWRIVRRKSGRPGRAVRLFGDTSHPTTADP